MKNNIGYFTHEVGAPDHRKFLILRAYYGGTLGWAMEAKFWALNCLIGDADGCRLDTTLKGEKARIARALELSLSELADFIRVLVDEAELLHDDAGVLWTDQTQEDLGRAMAVREKSGKYRNGQKRDASRDESQTSRDESQKSPDEIHGAEQSRAERRGEEQEPRAPEKSAEAEDLDFAAFGAYCLRLATERKAKNPAAMARKLAGEPDVIAGFKALRGALSTGGPKPDTPCPPPPKCDCSEQGEIKADRVSGTGRCLACGAWYSYDAEWGWTREVEPASANTG